ncbi:hypothetical protein BV22DRAFT_1052333, partial [Leucogyrophana mollusca]
MATSEAQLQQPGPAAAVSSRSSPETEHPSSSHDHDLEDPNISLAQRRTWRSNCRLPKRYRDVLPEPPPSLAVTALADVANTPSTNAEPSLQPSTSAPQSSHPESSLRQHVDSVITRLRRFFRTRRNTFGVIREYYGDELPSHDPEDPTPPDESQCQQTDVNPSQNPFHPYPNASSFRLGNWYWNQGVQKSQESFKHLLDVVAHPEFRPADVQEWTDKHAGWKKTPVVIQVPFHSKTSSPGSKAYHAVDLYHRSLVGILRETLANPQRDSEFHYEPYNMFWHPPHLQDEVRVHREMYTSEAFVQAHKELQDSPPEPGCDLPRVVAGLMF